VLAILTVRLGSLLHYPRLPNRNGSQKKQLMAQHRGTDILCRNSNPKKQGLGGAAIKRCLSQEST